MTESPLRSVQGERVFPPGLDVLAAFNTLSATPCL